MQQLTPTMRISDSDWNPKGPKFEITFQGGFGRMFRARATSWHPADRIASRYQEGERMSESGAEIGHMSTQHHRLRQRRKELTLTPALFGKLLVLSWAARYGKSDFIDRDTFVRACLENINSAPESIRLIMHLEDRIGSPSIAEYTEYMVAAQDDDLLKRYNPSYVRTVVDVDRVEAFNILDRYETIFSSELKWVRDLVNTLSQK